VREPWKRPGLTPGRSGRSLRRDTRATRFRTLGGPDVLLRPYQRPRPRSMCGAVDADRSKAEGKRLGMAIKKVRHAKEPDAGTACGESVPRPPACRSEGSCNDWRHRLSAGLCVIALAIRRGARSVIVFPDYRGTQLSSASGPRPAGQPPIISNYKGWAISVTPSRIDDFWRARVRVWPPEVRPDTHPGIEVSFSGVSSDRRAVEQTATAAGREFIEASLLARPQSPGVPSAGPIPAEQPPVISQYKGWIISVMPSVVQSSPDLWRARVRVWPPEIRPETHPGIDVLFSGAAADRGAIEQAATAAAHRYIEASVPVHPR
jgi:hypothetical protein